MNVSWISAISFPASFAVNRFWILDAPRVRKIPEWDGTTQGTTGNFDLADRRVTNGRNDWKLAWEKVRHTELVDARNDNMIWADSYERDLRNIFSIQSEIAQTIASRLSAQLFPEERKDIEETPEKQTNNLEAYDLQLQAGCCIVVIRCEQRQRCLVVNHWLGRNDGR